MQHLAALGYRRIAYAGGPVASWSNRARAETLRNVRAESPELDLIESGNFPPFFSGGIQAGDLAIASGATAIVAFDDLMAVGLIYRLRQRGLSVPDDISVSGFDNVRVSRLVWPNLTTVHFPRIRMAIYRAMTAAGGGESRQLISAMGVVYTAIMLIILIIALRFINPTQLVAQVKESRDD